MYASITYDATTLPSKLPSTEGLNELKQLIKRYFYVENVNLYTDIHLMFLYFFLFTYIYIYIYIYTTALSLILNILLTIPKNLVDH